MKTGLLSNTEPKDYKFSEGYKKLTGGLGKVYWAVQVWSNFNVPKHAFIFWLVMKERLQTKARLVRFLSINPICERDNCD